MTTATTTNTQTIHPGRKLLRVPLLVAVVMAVASLGFFAPVWAQDLTDNETCLDCHADTVRGPPKNPDRPRVHTDEGGFNVESHEIWSCVDCHDYITEIPHPEEVLGSEVDCLNCHETVPTK